MTTLYRLLFIFQTNLDMFRFQQEKKKHQPTILKLNFDKCSFGDLVKWALANSFWTLIKNAKGQVKATIGLRQEDLLSPFLFTIAVDVLSRMMIEVKESSLLGQTRVSLLQFVDDTIFFSKVSLTNHFGLQANIRA